jgi:beta-lactamase class D
MSNKTDKKTNLEVALNNAADVPEMLKAIDEKIKKFKRIEESVYKTTGKLDGFGDLKQEKLVSNLIRAVSVVIAKEKAYNEAAEKLGLTTYPVFEISGSQAKDWIEDARLRIDIIEQKDTLDKLQDYKKRMQEFLSKEDQKNILLREMQDFLGTKGQVIEESQEGGNA